MKVKQMVQVLFTIVNDKEKKSMFWVEALRWEQYHNINMAVYIVQTSRQKAFTWNIDFSFIILFSEKTYLSLISYTSLFLLNCLLDHPSFAMIQCRQHYTEQTALTLHVCNGVCMDLYPLNTHIMQWFISFFIYCNLFKIIQCFPSIDNSVKEIRVELHYLEIKPNDYYIFFTVLLHF